MRDWSFAFLTGLHCKRRINGYIRGRLNVSGNFKNSQGMLTELPPPIAKLRVPQFLSLLEVPFTCDRSFFFSIYLFLSILIVY